MQQITPARAPVQPRTVSPITGEIVLLHEAVSTAIAGATVGVVQILGGPGSGKTTAMRHLAAVLPPSAGIEFLDEVNVRELPAHLRQRLIICGAAEPASRGVAFVTLASFPLASWGVDECVEYLLNVHPTRCASVMQRVGTDPDRLLLQGSPELWKIVLDVMAADDSTGSIREALHRVLASWMQTTEARAGLQAACLNMLLDPSQGEGTLPQLPAGLSRLVRHRACRLSVAAAGIIDLLRTSGPLVPLERPLPTDLVRMLASSLDHGARSRLESVISSDDGSKQAMAASLLFAENALWRPPGRRRLDLSGGYFPRARWESADLSRMNFRAADLRLTNLSRSDLNHANLALARLSGTVLRDACLHACRCSGADFSRADLSSSHADSARFDATDLNNASLRGASLKQSTFADGDLTGADFTAADLTQARLDGANLSGANLIDAQCERADFRTAVLDEATLSGARFTEADLGGCCLEYADLSGTDFRKANLEGTLLTGSQAHGVCFRQARLRGAGLAEIDWEGVDLREADLRECHFHLGSSRSGLVGSPLACEGSRTGFYTDDYNEQDFKAPEEIRKANLCRADLRGAEIEGTDFYLVDLRGALYTREQEMHFRRCGAILEELTRDR